MRAPIAVIMSVGVLGILFMVTRMGASGDMGRNGAVGIRTKATQRSDAAWHAGHAAALPVARTACLVVLVVDLICLVLIFAGPEALTPWLGIVPAVALLIAVVPTVLAATKGADAAPPASGP